MLRIAEQSGLTLIEIAQTLMREYAALPHTLGRWPTASAEIEALPAPYVHPPTLAMNPIPTPHRTSTTRRFWSCGGWSVVLAPVTIVIHELGHLLVARAVGFPNPVLHFSSVDPGAAPGLPDSALGLATLAGPIVSALLALVACAWIRWRAPTPFALALAVAAVTRFAIAIPYTFVTGIIGLVGGQLEPPAFDEYKAGAALGWSGDLLLAGTSGLCIAVLWWVGRHLQGDARGATWTGLLVGTASGWALWMKGLGPWLLP